MNSSGEVGLVSGVETPVKGEGATSDERPSMEGFESITEGSAVITFASSSSAFYNPVQQFNRDLTVTVLRQFVDDRIVQLHSKKEPNGKGGEASEGGGDEPQPKKARRIHIPQTDDIRILDALSASGLRAIRFAKEVPHVSTVIANDFSEEALKSIERNIRVNHVQHIVEKRFGDATETMMLHRALDKRFHAIDLDPYGSASPFLDSAVQAVADRGILMITCTDMGVLCGNTPEACYNKYDAVALRHKSCHEMAIRILLRSVESHANRYARYIEPLLSISVDFYVRVFVRVHTSAVIAKDSVIKASYVHACSGCQGLSLQPLAKKIISGTSVKFSSANLTSELAGPNGRCTNCGGALHLGGPIYSAPIHDLSFVNSLLARLQATPVEKRLATHNRLLGVLSVVAEEVQDVALYYEHDQLMHVVKCHVPKLLATRSAILNAGYRCSIAHCNPRAIKTDAPLSFLWDIARTIAKEDGVLASRFGDGTPARTILDKQIAHEISFKLNAQAEAQSKRECLVRFQCNKGKNWGPKAKAKGSVNSVKAAAQVNSDVALSTAPSNGAS